MEACALAILFLLTAPASRVQQPSLLAPCLHSDRSCLLPCRAVCNKETCAAVDKGQRLAKQDTFYYTEASPKWNVRF